MAEKIANIAKNTSYYTFALILQKVISFTYFTLMARALGPDDLGKYYFAISFTTIFAIFIDIGQSNVLTREVAKDQNKAGDFLKNILFIKIPLSVLSFLAVALIVNLMGYPDITRQLVYLSAVCMILDSFTLTFFAVSRGFHNLKFESISSVVFQAIVFVVVLISLKLNLGLRWLMMSLVLASVYNFIYSLLVVKKKWGISVWPKYDKELTSIILKISAPFAVYAIFQRVYTYLDSVFLSFFAGDKYVGIYQIPFKIINALQFLPSAFIASLYPAMSAYWQHNREQLAVTFERAMNYLIIISLPISVIFIVLADKIVFVFKSGYDEAIFPLQITMLSLVFTFLNFPVGSLLNACDRQRTNTRNMGVVLLVSVFLNLLLIPRLQAVGASLTALVTNILMFILGMFIVPQIAKYNYKKILIIFAKTFAAVAVMGLVGYLLKNNVSLIFTLLLSGLTYFVALYLFKGFRKEDITSIMGSFKR